ncbi:MULTISPECIES: DUF3025 domain-containing protein [unclassified Psychrobacter]|jgi:hypothetical protein|uniref:DUF3025 domain-containing protein n=1 Tax=unclassified Psychrobacter TaxID=196806 RepID=UPI00041EBD44|nr:MULTISPECIES: DUF3025 domain-containing protein [unclassified Psychrobacter]
MTATDLPAKPYSTASSEAPITSLSTRDSSLDKSFAEIDWQVPWLAHLQQLDYISNAIAQLGGANAEGFNNAEGSHEVEGSNEAKLKSRPDVIAKVLNKALNQQSEHLQSQLPTTKSTQNNQAHALNFVSQEALSEGEAYESFIGTSGKIPTRDNLHDLFNGSIWLTFPKTKALLNYYHMVEIAQQGIGASRGRVRDTITVFDENGAVLVTSEPRIGEALINFDWQASLIEPRAQWDNPQQLNSQSRAAVYVFGHALLEQLIKPRKPLCAHSIVILVPQDFFALPLSARMVYLDGKIAQYMDKLLSQDNVTPRQLAPLPILGVPHFWAENADMSFYEDNYVFRHGRRQKKK